MSVSMCVCTRLSVSNNPIKVGILLVLNCFFSDVRFSSSPGKTCDESDLTSQSTSLDTCIKWCADHNSCGGLLWSESKCFFKDTSCQDLVDGMMTDTFFLKMGDIKLGEDPK